MSPYPQRDYWSPAGVYGPFERLLTYHDIYEFGKLLKPKNIDIACVGGLTTPEHGIEAIQLGADVVQLSSAIAWNGISIFKKYNMHLRQIEKIDSIDEMKGSALEHILPNADAVFSDEQTQPLKACIDEAKCVGCGNCCNRMCIAIYLGNDYKAHVVDSLCSGCSWCSNFCFQKAISYC